MMSEIMDLDSKQNMRYVSESSSTSTSGYSTMSPGGGTVSACLSPSSSSVFSSPTHSPATMMQMEFTNLNLPANSPQYIPQQTSQHYTQLQNAIPNAYVNSHAYQNVHHGAMVTLHSQNYNGLQTTIPAVGHQVKQECVAKLKILEQPVEKFRFRYKSEMHGTHGSLNGANSKRTPKTFPEVELTNFHGRAVIRCSLFQTNMESPHSHQLVVRRDDTDICDPHDLHVSPEIGYVAQFQNMGIIHTAKKFIFNELLKKKTDRLLFELGRDELSTKQTQELHKETEKEAKDMNLNQVRLCFEAFKVEENNTWTRIAAPVYSNPINNRKSAQTGELRITRLSIATGSVSGGDDLILLVEKVSKKNIKVRFYELNEDEETVWEAFGRFRESDVHHQYAIVCQTPAYKNREIENPVEVCIELLRPSDDERSYPPVTFRYKPRDVVASRKRRRTNSSITTSSSSSSSLSSVELPKTIQEQATTIGSKPNNNYPTISQEFDKDNVLNEMIGNFCAANSDELRKMCPAGSFDLLIGGSDLIPGVLEHDGTSSNSIEIGRKQTTSSMSGSQSHHAERQCLIKILQIYEETRTAKNIAVESPEWKNAAQRVARIYVDYADRNAGGYSLIHEVVANDWYKEGIKMGSILNYFHLNDLLNRVLDTQKQTPLHCACLHNRVHYIRPLLGLGCNPNLQDHKGNTALHIAVREQHHKCIESFLAMEGQRVNLALKNDKGFTPLHMAIRENNVDIVEKLLKLDEKAAYCTNTQDGNNALHMAVVQQNLDMINVILKGQIVEKMLTACNAAGQTVIALAKDRMGHGKDSKKNEIWDFLIKLSKNADIKMQIKEEEISSSSTDDEESTSSSLEAFDLIKIKEELNTDAPKSTKDVKYVLNDENKLKALVKLLEADLKWKKLAEKLKINHLLCLWKNAEDMLEYLKNNAILEWQLFASALAEVEPKTLQYL